MTMKEGFVIDEATGTLLRRITGPAAALAANVRAGQTFVESDVPLSEAAVESRDGRVRIIREAAARDMLPPAGPSFEDAVAAVLEKDGVAAALMLIARRLE